MLAAGNGDRFNNGNGKLLASGGEEATPAAPAPTAETDPPVEVRTQVVRRTLHLSFGEHGVQLVNRHGQGLG